MLFVSGQLPVDPKTNEIVGIQVKEQTEQSIVNIENVLKAAGFRLEDVVKTSVFLTDMSRFPK